MLLFLIRHGQSVDNVAQIYSGSRDCALTVNGYHQACRLGQHLDAQGVHFTHMFASTLQRAHHTAQLLHDAQNPAGYKAELVLSDLIREKSFGLLEGHPYTGAFIPGNPHVPVNMETRESMVQRLDLFISDHVKPLMYDAQAVVAVVAHGLILGVLWERLVVCLEVTEIHVNAPELAGRAPESQGIQMPKLVNTGYHRLHIHDVMQDIPANVNANLDLKNKGVAVEPRSIPRERRIAIESANNRNHLIGMHMAKGVGTTQYDEKQQKIETFFKPR